MKTLKNYICKTNAQKNLKKRVNTSSFASNNFLRSKNIMREIICSEFFGLQDQLTIIK
jgi:hypothetical protein